MALLLLAILRDGKPRTAEEIAATVARVIRAVEAPEDDAPEPARPPARRRGQLTN